MRKAEQCGLALGREGEADQFIPLMNKRRIYKLQWENDCKINWVVV
jgi:hypothetical protein